MEVVERRPEMYLGTLSISKLKALSLFISGYIAAQMGHGFDDAGYALLGYFNEFVSDFYSVSPGTNAISLVGGERRRRDRSMEYVLAALARFSGI